MDALAHLLPLPAKIDAGGSGFDLSGPYELRAAPEAAGPALERLRAELEAHGAEEAAGPAGSGPRIELRLEPGSAGGEESYVLEVHGKGARVLGADAAGLFYGTQTLAQLVRGAAGRLPGVRIEDRPSFRHRGVMLDVSRDRVPTMETLFALVDLFSSWKLNQLQLYTEHTFAYRRYEDVWRGCSPLTADEIRALDGYCRERFVELVPNQQSFGHFHRWLTHARLRDLAECPDGVDHPFLTPGNTTPEPFSLCPTDPRSLELLSELYQELLPNFESRRFNVGMDETFDLGRGRSSAACSERGVGPVYLDFLKDVHGLVEGHGHEMQFWADILLNHPELTSELPGGVVPMCWGYEADHPFEKETAILGASGRPFYVCPGTSSWQSLAGRFQNAMENVRSAVDHGSAHGAIGVLVTDWGDRGHLQPLAASHPGWIAAADLAWNASAPSERQSAPVMAELLSTHAFQDPTGESGRALVALAQLTEQTGVHVPNCSPLHRLLIALDERGVPPELEGLQTEPLAQIRDGIDPVLAALGGHRMGAPDARQVHHELTWAGGMLHFASSFGLARLEGLSTASMRDLRNELRTWVTLYPTLWRARSRPGGLERSRAWLDRILERLDGWAS